MTKQFDFVGRRKVFIGISLAILLVGIGCNFIFGVELDIAFKGGTLLKYSFAGDIDNGAVEQVIKEKLPDAEVYMMAYYPVNDHMPDRPFYSTFMFQVRNKKNLALVNAEMEKLAAEFGYHFINVNDGLTDENGDLKEEYTIEGIHMYPDAYRHVFRNLKPYLMGE